MVAPAGPGRSLPAQVVQRVAVVLLGGPRGRRKCVWATAEAVARLSCTCFVMMPAGAVLSIMVSSWLEPHLSASGGQVMSTEDSFWGQNGSLASTAYGYLFHSRGAISGILF